MSAEIRDDVALWFDEKTVSQFLEDLGFEWTYDGKRRLTFTLPHTPYGDELHEYLCEIGEPLPPEDAS